MENIRPVKLFYFGCIGQPGHFMHAQEGKWGRETFRFTRDNPWGFTVDGGLCPPGHETEGRAALHHKDDWTALAFWDRSVDRRGGSCSVFLASGEQTFDEMLALACARFPKVIARYKFEIVKA